MTEISSKMKTYPGLPMFLQFYSCRKSNLKIGKLGNDFVFMFLIFQESLNLKADSNVISDD